MTNFLQVKDNAQTLAPAGSLNNSTSPLVINGINTSLFMTVTTGYVVTIWDETMYPYCYDDPNMEKALVIDATIGASGSLTLSRGNPKFHTGTPRVALLAMSQHISDLENAVNTSETNIALKANTSSLATVATTGSYNDLSNKPTIPTVPVTSVAGKTGSVTLDKTDVGLPNVDNTTDVNKPISTATQTALDGKVDQISTNSRLYGTGSSGLQANYGIAATTFGASTIVQRSVGGVIFTGTPSSANHATTKDYVDTQNSAQDTVISGKISNITGLVTQGTGIAITGSGTSGSPYNISASGGGGGAVSSVYGRTGIVVAASGDYTGSQVTNTPAGNIAATDVQSAINELDTEKANLASPALTGTPTAPTATGGTNTTQLATTAFVRGEITSDNALDVHLAGTETITGDKTFSGSTTLGAVALNGAITIADAQNIVLGTTTGTKFGTASTQKIGFLGATPIAQGTSTADPIGLMANFGLRASGSGYPITTSGTVTFSGQTVLGFARYSQVGRVASFTFTGGSISEVNTVDATAGSVTITLTATATAGYRITVIRIDGTANSVSVVTAGGTGTINGVASYSVVAQYKYVTFTSTSTSGAWLVIGNN